MKTGDILVFFDDMKAPVMTATDKNFRWGRVGVGSFDDTSDWTRVRVRGKLQQPIREGQARGTANSRYQRGER